MRIALIAPLISPLREPQLGGAQTHLTDVAIGLGSRGHQVDVYAASGSVLPGLSIVDTGVDPSLQRDSMFRYGADGARSDAARFAFAGVCAAVDAGGYDIVHNHAFDAPAVRAAMGIRAPVVHTLHLPPEAIMAAAIREAQASARPPTAAAVSEFHAASWRAVVRIGAILRPGIPVAHVPFGAAPGSGLLFAGRLSPEKGALEAIAIAEAAGQALDLYGDAYDHEYAIEVGRRARRAGVHLHAAAERGRLWELMGRAQAVLCPSTWEEPFGLVAAEANAAGTPVVAFRSGALPEVVVDGDTGVVVDPGDISAAAAAAAKVATFDRQACRRHAEANLDIGATLDAHEQLYARLLTSSAASGST